MNKIFETLFSDFLESHHTGDLAEEMNRISAEIDRQIEAGNADAVIDLTGDHELAALKFGYYAGFMAGAENAKGIIKQNGEAVSPPPK